MTPALQKRRFAVALGKRMAAIRGSATQEEFARSLGLHKNSIGNYERGVHLPDASVILQLYEIHGVRPLWLLTGYTNEPARPTIHNSQKEE